VSQHTRCYQHIVHDNMSISVNLTVPTGWAVETFEPWCTVLTGQDLWRIDEDQTHKLLQLKNHEQVFISSFLQVSQLLFVLARIPIFDLPTIKNLKLKTPNQGDYLLEVSLPTIHFAPMSLYKQVLSIAFELCQWMTTNPVTPNNRQTIFNSVSQKVIKPLGNVLPSGNSTIPTLRAAHSLGIPFKHVGLGVYQLGWGSKARLLDRSVTIHDSWIGAKLTQNKISTADMLRTAGLPAPFHIKVSTENESFIAAEHIRFPVVIKPIDQNRGEGITVNVIDKEALKQAFEVAKKASPAGNVIVERQVPGVCHRIVIVGQQLLYAVKRRPMSILGDGTQTVRQLVEDEMAAQLLKAPWQRSELQQLDELARQTLDSVNLSEDSVPSKGEWVPLRPIESTQWGGIQEDVTTSIHQENIDAAVRATALFGLQTAGVDFMSEDITQPWYKNDAVIIEVNFAPTLGRSDVIKSYQPKFISHFMSGNGKIPIERVDNKKMALSLQASYLSKGVNCFMTSPTITHDYAGRSVFLPFKTLKERVNALVTRSDVDAILLYPVDNYSVITSKR
jgi:cyanophycin synthetase